MNNQAVNKINLKVIFIVIIFCMFVVPIKYNNDNNKQQVKSSDNTGAREFKKLNSFQFHYWFDRQRAPIFINLKNLFIMPIKKKNKSTNGAKELDTTVSEIKDLHSDSRQSLIKSLYNQSVSSLIRDFLIEMDAKNKAYFFILQNGHYDAFSIYCKAAKGGAV